MRFKCVANNAEHVGRNVGVGSNQTQLHFDDSDNGLLETFKGDVVDWSYYLGCTLVPRVPEYFTPSTLVIVGSPFESRVRNNA